MKRAKQLWFRRLGVVGGLLFLAKGLLWLSIPAVLTLRQCGA